MSLGWRRCGFSRVAHAARYVPVTALIPLRHPGAGDETVRHGADSSDPAF